ncbi:hypothetical protein B0T25DRAFT_500907 [Lasiosphaeria hispida]|uniref:Uncharacterized protein n=1 Tax=Lasiosphaeria hispida TaxID=260671 RepID=A0AAJ0HHQ1_9PEZI|nr:hypothetical protein B0T25DRAFT_500907 [Lasiosphaeria hispida]
MDATEYARRNGLTIDSFTDPLLGLLDNDTSIAATTTPTAPGHLFELDQLEECLFRTIIPIPEQCEMPRASLILLHQVCKPCKGQELTGLMEDLCFAGAVERKKLKLEVPVLRSDHNMDCRRLRQKVEAFRKPQLPEHRLPLYPADGEEGEGVEFPGSARKSDTAIMKNIEKELFEMKRETLVYLMQTLKADWTAAEQTDLVDSISTYKGVRARDYLTPPLSPCVRPSPDYFIPDEELCELPEPSDISTGLCAELEATEARLLKDDFEFWNEKAAQDLASPGRYDDLGISEMIKAGQLRSRSPSSSPRLASRNLKVDVPVLPSNANQDSAQGAATKVLAPEDLAQARALVSSSDTLSGEPGASDGQFAEFIRAKADSVMRKAEQEKLQPLDATARVSVPVMDFSIPAPDWGSHPWEAGAMFRWIREKMDASWQEPKWPNNKIAEKRMVWTPLAHMAQKTLLSEKIEASPSVLELFLKRPRSAEVMSSADCIFKRLDLLDILRTRDNESDIDGDTTSYANSPEMPMIAPPPFRQLHPPDTRPPPIRVGPPMELQPRQPIFNRSPALSEDLTTLLKGRKRLLDEMLQPKLPAGNTDGERQRLPDFRASDFIDPSVLDSTNVLRGFVNEYTDFAPLVDNFVEINTPKKTKLAHASSYFGTPGIPIDIAAAPPKPFADETKRLMPSSPRPVPAMAPSIAAPKTPPRVIVSAVLSRLLTNQISNLIPGIDLIPRDYTKHCPLGWFPGRRSPSADEADVILSPATGLLTTTMVQLRQRPLPGKTNQVIFRHTVKNVAVRYERLIILISEGNKHNETMSPLSQSDAKALGEFQGFAAGLKTDVQVFYVGGGIETLAKWIAAEVCGHAGETLPVQDLLVSAETGWELFLRRAGMNAYAAQVTLAMLKVPDEEPAIGGQRLYGLPAFVMLTPEERVDMLARALGGRRVLDRVSEVIDKPWRPPVLGEAPFSQDRGFLPGGFGGE